MIYTEQFKKALSFAEEKKLFLGLGNPNAKILILGKEHYFEHQSETDTESFYNEILSSREKGNQNNINNWKYNIETNFIPCWDKDHLIANINPIYAWGSQLNKANRKLKNNEYNYGTSTTYLSYQKLYQHIYLEGKKSKIINFQRGFFLSELNDIPSKKSFNITRLNVLRDDSIQNRIELFKQSYFREFPIVIIAAGHYPKTYKFNIQDIFDVEYTGKPHFAGNSWINIHYSKNKDRLVIHTRQLSTSTTNDLLQVISELISKFLLQTEHMKMLT